MTITAIILWVDKQDGITEKDVEKYVQDKCGDTEHSRRLCMNGISRLAGNNQIAGNLDEHKRLLAYVMKHYWRTK